MVALLISAIAAAVFTWCGWFLDQRVLRCQTRVRLISTLVLLCIATWLVALIQLAFWLQVPGAYGPVQYWGDTGHGFMGVRALAMFAVLGGMFAALIVFFSTVASLFIGSKTLRLFRCVVPAIALAAFAWAYYMFFEYEFFPSA